MLPPFNTGFPTVSISITVETGTLVMMLLSLAHALEEIGGWLLLRLGLTSAKRFANSHEQDWLTPLLVFAGVGIVAYLIYSREKTKMTTRSSSQEAYEEGPQSGVIVMPDETSPSWRERLQNLPVDNSIILNGLVVWKIVSPDGKVYFSGERTFSSVDEVLKHYKLE